LAPGAYVASTYLNNGFASMAGTSMASPMVAAAAVLVHQALDLEGESAIADESHILSILKATGVSIVDSGYGQDNVNHTGLTFKRLDVYAALQSILGGAFTPPPNQSPPSSYLSPNAAFVTSLYQVVLGRDVDPAGLSTWVDRLNAGMSRMQLVTMLWNSAEHRALQVVADYQAFLHRAPGASEVAQWVNTFQAGASEDQVADAFLHSQEYLWSQPSNAGFVQKLFNDILGRSADPAGLASWTSVLDRGIVSRSQLADLVLHSNERNVNEIGDYYQQFLGRAASAAEKQTWATLVDQGYLSLPSVAAAFLASQEFYNRAPNSNGLSLGEQSLNPPPDDTSNGGYLPFTTDFASHSHAFDGWEDDDPSRFGELAAPNSPSNEFAARQNAYPWADPSGSISLRIGSSQTASPANGDAVSPDSAPADRAQPADDDQAQFFDRDELDLQDEIDLALLAEIRALQQAVDEALGR